MHFDWLVDCRSPDLHFSPGSSTAGVDCWLRTNWTLLERSAFVQCYDKFVMCNVYSAGLSAAGVFFWKPHELERLDKI